jgi:hypothetical protein
MRFASRLFLVAGLYGLAVLLPQYFLEDRISSDSPPPIAHPEYFYGFIGVAVAWQVAFLVIARDPVRYRPLMIPAILEKVSVAAAVIVLFVGQRVSESVLAFALLDLVFAALFLWAFVRTRPTPVPPVDPGDRA